MKVFLANRQSPKVETGSVNLKKAELASEMTAKRI
jgi:hypothetical protein